MTAGLAPATLTEVNTKIGTTLRQFSDVRSTLLQHQRWLAATDLKVAPYNMAAADETNLKSAVAGLNTELQAFDMTFVDRCTGP